MGISRFTDFVYAFRLIYILQQPWKETSAFKFGIVDENGVALRKYKELKTDEEKGSFTKFHKIAFNLKRLISAIPGGDSRLAKLAVGLRLLKESNGELDQPFTDHELNFLYNKISDMVLNEDTPTNVTGSAVSTNIEKPLAKIARRKVVDEED